MWNIIVFLFVFRSRRVHTVVAYNRVFRITCFRRHGNIEYEDIFIILWAVNLLLKYYFNNIIIY